jgi:hypothetical protein
MLRRLRHPALHDTEVPCTEYGDSAYLAAFFGTVHPDRGYSQGIRQDLTLEYCANTGARVGEHGILMVSHHTSRGDYVSSISTSRFCLCPSAWAQWSPRIYSAIATGCIPVLVKVPKFKCAAPIRVDCRLDLFYHLRSC